MSAIFGIVCFNGNEKVNEVLLKMQQALNHWNADDNGLWQNAKVGLGHLMLWNTPESLHEKLPLHNSISNCTITADARIDNREELFEKLNIDYALRKEMPDSSLILKAYEKYGKDCVQHLIGDFAFAVWDENKQQLFCARDHMGIRPFFYFKDEHHFAFASEKKGLLALENVIPRIDEIDENYLIKMAGGIYPKNYWETLYKNVFRLQPANLVIVENTKILFKKYWELNIHHEIYFKNSNDYIECFKEKFTNAIQVRLRSNNDIATELSGGLDSSGISCIAASLLHGDNKKITTLSIAGTKETAIYGTHEERDNEFINAVIDFAKIDTPLILRDSGYNNWIDEIDTLLKINDGPELSTIIWALPLKREAAKNNCKTILSGFGGDELVTNFSNQYYLDALAANKLISFYKQASQELTFLQIFKALLSHKLPFIINPLKQIIKPDISKNLTPEINFLKNEWTQPIKNSESNVNYIPYNFKDVQKQFLNNSFVHLRVEAENLAGYLYRIDTRFPMLDVSLLEYTLSLPAHQKMRKDIDRYLFRNAMQGLIPELVLNEKVYTGYSKPYALYEWVQQQNEKSTWINKLVSENKTPKYLNLEKVLKGYNLEINDKSDNKKFFAFRKLIESILRFKQLESITKKYE